MQRVPQALQGAKESRVYLELLALPGLLEILAQRVQLALLVLKALKECLVQRVTRGPLAPQDQKVSKGHRVFKESRVCRVSKVQSDLLVTPVALV